MSAPLSGPSKAGYSRRGVRAVEGARLESVYGFIAHRGFESLSLRQLNIKILYKSIIYVGYVAASSFGTRIATQKSFI